MVSLAWIKNEYCDEYFEYKKTTFYVNNKQVPRKFFYSVSEYYYRKYLYGFYSREVKRTSGYFQIKYFSNKIMEDKHND